MNEHINSHLNPRMGCYPHQNTEISTTFDQSGGKKTYANMQNYYTQGLRRNNHQDSRTTQPSSNQINYWDIQNASMQLPVLWQPAPAQQPSFLAQDTYDTDFRLHSHTDPQVDIHYLFDAAPGNKSTTPLPSINAAFLNSHQNQAVLQTQPDHVLLSQPPTKDISQPITTTTQNELRIETTIQESVNKCLSETTKKLEETTSSCQKKITEMSCAVRKETEGLENLASALNGVKNAIYQDIKASYQSASDNFERTTEKGNEKIQKSITSFESNTEALEAKFNTTLEMLNQLQEKLTANLQEVNQMRSTPKITKATQTELALESLSKASDSTTADFVVTSNTTEANTDTISEQSRKRDRKSNEDSEEENSGTNSEPARKSAKKNFQDSKTKTDPKSNTEGKHTNSDLDPKDINKKTPEIIKLANSVATSLNITTIARLPSYQIMEAAASLISNDEHHQIIAKLTPPPKKNKLHLDQKSANQARKSQKCYAGKRREQDFLKLKNSVKGYIEKQSKEALSESTRDILKKATSILVKQIDNAKYLRTRSVGPQANLSEFLENSRKFGFDKPSPLAAAKREKP
ncbi:hypothetical protein [Endozoicomonas sp.]|uniref:hypothetical protein n=1 Tax=Endozoicomonas sp. TaxID=1892382 RepID=UPI0028838CEC|nr:hypothetical protein [Endozoicomonas sp.]